MKIVITLVKRVVENKVLMGHSVDEKVAENVDYFTVSDGRQCIDIHYNDKYNDKSEETIKLMSGDENHSEQWILLDIKSFLVPMKVK